MAVLVIYFFAAALICAIAFVSWRLVGTQQPMDAVSDRRPAPRGPDDDPDFLRSLDR